MSATEIFKQFVDAINLHDPEVLVSLMHMDHTFVDSLGHQVRGAKTMGAGWRGYFAMCPDYWLKVVDVVSQDSLVLAAGEAGGAIDGKSWQTPAAWKAIIQDGLVLEWHVFADNKPVYDILAGRKSKSS